MPSWETCACVATPRESECVCVREREVGEGGGERVIRNSTHKQGSRASPGGRLRTLSRADGAGCVGSDEAADGNLNPKP